MVRYFFISEQSRKAKSVRQAYESLRNRIDKNHWIESSQWEGINGVEGVPVPSTEISRLLNLKLQDEHLSPFVKTDMNLFQMHMLDDRVQIQVFKADHGWLLVYDGVTEGPQPFGNVGYDTR